MIDGKVYRTGISPDGQLVAVTKSGKGVDSTIRIIDRVTGAELQQLKGHEFVYEIVFSPDGRKLASASDDGTVRIWSVGKKKEPDPSLHKSGGGQF